VSRVSKGAKARANRPPRNPGSLRPFHRINTLVAAVAQAQELLQKLLEVKPGLLAKLVGKTERTPEQVKALGDAQEAVIRARAALAGYKSRGHGKQRRFK